MLCIRIAKSGSLWLEHEIQRGRRDGSCWAQGKAGPPRHANELGLYPKQWEVQTVLSRKGACANLQFIQMRYQCTPIETPKTKNK